MIVNHFLHPYILETRSLWTGAKSILAAAWLVSLAACQSGDPEDVMDGVQAPTAQVQTGEVFGSGATRIAMLLHRSGQAYDQKLATAFYNGARLAVEDLGKDHVTLAIEDTGSSASRIKEQIAAEAASQMLILPGDSASVQAALSSGQGSKEPIIALGSRPGSPSGNAYWFLPGPLQQLEAGGEYVSRLFEDGVSGIIIAPTLTDADTISHLAQRLGPYTKTLELARYQPGKGAGSISSQGKEALKRANAIFLMGSDSFALQLLMELRQSVEGRGAKAYVVEADLMQKSSGNQALNGAIAALPDDRNLDLIRGRYEKAYGEVMPIEAAYAYDAIAIAAGLARSGQGISDERLQANKGFKATTGSFRFRPDGRVERLFQIAKVSDGEIDILEASAAGF